MRIDVGGAATVEVASSTSPSLVGSVVAALRPYGPGPDGGPTAEVVIRPLATPPVMSNIQNPAGDGLTTGYDGERAYVFHGRRACSVPDPLRECPAVFECSRDFPIHELVGWCLRPAIALAALRHEAVVVHASAVALDGRAVLIGGWSESGKTEIALALAEAGAAFLSDKWTIVRSDGTVCPFPASVGIRRWVLPYLPRLRDGLPRGARAQLAAAVALSAGVAPLRRSFRNPALREVSALAGRASATADRAALSVADVRKAHRTPGNPTEPVPLGAVVLLSTVAQGSLPCVLPADPAVVARRLALAAAFERRMYFSVTDRTRYAGANHERAETGNAACIEMRHLRARFAACDVVEVRTPFPADPRVAADQLVGAITR